MYFSVYVIAAMGINQTLVSRGLVVDSIAWKADDFLSVARGQRKHEIDVHVRA
jgi:hypothetical protein